MNDGTITLRATKKRVAVHVIMALLCGSAMFSAAPALAVAFGVAFLLLAVNAVRARYTVEDGVVHGSWLFGARPEVNLRHLSSVTVSPWIWGFMLRVTDQSSQSLKFASISWTGWRALARVVRQNISAGVDIAPRSLDRLDKLIEHRRG